MEAGLLDSIVVPQIREQSVKAATLSTESTAESTSPKNNQACDRGSMFQRCAFEVNASFARREPIITRIVPTKFKQETTAKDIQRRIIKERFEAKIRAIKRPQHRVVGRGLGQYDKLLRLAMHQNNRSYPGSRYSIFVPMLLNEKTLSKKYRALYLSPEESSSSILKTLKEKLNMK